MLEQFKTDTVAHTNVFSFAREYFQAWWAVNMSNDTNIISVTINTTRLMAAVGIKLKFGATYFKTLNRHLYHLNGVFLPLSTGRDHADLVADCFDEF